jgi:hypothetical protein
MSSPDDHLQRNHIIIMDNEKNIIRVSVCCHAILIIGDNENVFLVVLGKTYSGK